MNLTKDIINNRKRHGFLGAIVVGPPGIGKSVYGMIIAKEIYYVDQRAKGIIATADECWDWARQQIVHGTEQLANAIEGYSNSNKRKILIWDDAGEGGGTYAFSRGFGHMDALTTTLNLIRSHCECLLITSITFEGLTKFIRDYPYYKITISKGSKTWDRVATTRFKVLRQFKKSGIERMTWTKRYKEYFSCYMPNAKYNEYIKYREAMMNNALKRLIKENAYINKKQKQKMLRVDKELKELKEDG